MDVSGNVRQIVRKTTHCADMSLFQYLGVKFSSGENWAWGFLGICSMKFRSWKVHNSKDTYSARGRTRSFCYLVNIFLPPTTRTSVVPSLMLWDCGYCCWVYYKVPKPCFSRFRPNIVSLNHISAGLDPVHNLGRINMIP